VIAAASSKVQILAQAERSFSIQFHILPVQSEEKLVEIAAACLSFDIGAAP